MSGRLPVNQSEYYSQKGLVVGCYRIKCGDCGEWVRHFDKVRFSAITLAEDECEWLWRSKSLPKRDYIQKDDDSRVYVCRCAFAQTMTTESLASVENIHWYCGGHPQ